MQPFYPMLLALTLVVGAVLCAGAAAFIASSRRAEHAPVTPVVVLALAVLFFVAASMVAIFVTLGPGSEAAVRGLGG